MNKLYLLKILTGLALVAFAGESFATVTDLKSMSQHAAGQVSAVKDIILMLAALGGVICIILAAFALKKSGAESDRDHGKRAFILFLAGGILIAVTSIAAVMTGTLGVKQSTDITTKQVTGF